MVDHLRKARSEQLLEKCIHQLHTDPTDSMVFSVKPDWREELEQVRAELINAGYVASDYKYDSYEREWFIDVASSQDRAPWR